MAHRLSGGQPLALDITPSLQDLADKSIVFGVRLVGFLAIVSTGILVAWGVRALADKALRRLMFNRLAERAGVSRWAGRYSPSTVAAKLIGYALLLITFQVAFHVFGPNPVSALLDGIVRWLPRALVAGIIVLIAAAVGHIAYDVIATSAARLPYGRGAARTAQVIIVSLGAVAALTQVGVSVALPILLAVLGTVGGVIIVGVGGGLIQPMRERWERMLTRVDIERCRWAFELNRDVPRHTAAGMFPHSGSTGNAAAAGHRAARGTDAAGTRAGHATDSTATRAGHATDSTATRAGHATDSTGTRAARGTDAAGTRASRAADAAELLERDGDLRDRDAADLLDAGDGGRATATTETEPPPATR